MEAPAAAAPARRGVTVKDVPAAEFIHVYAAHLKRQNKLRVPKWAEYVKTGCLKELSPLDPDWYYIRAASMARKLYLRGKIGVGSFQRIYGGRKNNGACPSHFVESSGKVARQILHDLEKLNVVTRDGEMRRLSQEGQRDLDGIAGQRRYTIPILFFPTCGHFTLERAHLEIHPRGVRNRGLR
ncbi:putative 40S ribosomal protein S19-1 [Paratrimastix pyriformis]|uniref:40S ribosomal protein S19-1 n=1 Tax=Paratrimastix pyriformis TaxID=342808 RepID=A0ABQ8UC38_9EUKA|nr:putative 40S ribosomal protein S19-1 [Paratrimastix pyriformis]